tara:strand:+ start:141 stop:413 length:273 start_codon:yes stop_codon:yes gene_type:complete
MNNEQIEKRIKSIPELRYHFDSGTAYPEDCYDWEVSDTACRMMKTKEHFIDFIQEVIWRMDDTFDDWGDNKEGKSQYRRMNYLLKQIKES